MDPTRFDRVSKLFAERRLSRRQALATSGAALAATGRATAGLTAAAQDATPAATGEKIPYLFVQSFQSGSIAPTEGQDGRYTVTLEQGLGQTIYFADRPSRDVGTTPTPQFLESIGFPEDNPPNAALLVETGEGETDIAVVELFNPTYDEATHTATYDVEVLENWEDDLDLGFSEAPADLAALAPAFGTAHLLIDDCPNDSIDCINVLEGDAYEGGFDNQPFCYNYALCIPCVPYYHDQPDRCSTVNYWTDQCNQTYANCQLGDGGNNCISQFASLGLLCVE